ncbi:MAG: DUF4363 family protein [Oscillospiraceae bacterium]|nr:DUF4363 family protein [Oscillospiraceae bacterium]
MKYFWIGVMILCLLLTGCFLSQRELRQRTEAVAAPLAQAIAAYQRGETEQGRRLSETAALEWERKEGVLASLLSHNYTNRISAALAELGRTGDEDFLRVCEGLLRDIRALAEQERAVWRNIF